MVDAEDYSDTLSLNFLVYALIRRNDCKLRSVFNTNLRIHHSTLSKSDQTLLIINEVFGLNCYILHSNKCIWMIAHSACIYSV